VSLNTADQVIFATGLNIVTNGAAVQYPFGAVLPAATLDVDIASRNALRGMGALRMVAAATDPADFNAAALTAAEAGEVQSAGTLPVLMTPDGLPVVADY
jgi:hypothetical protein